MPHPQAFVTATALCLLHVALLVAEVGFGFRVWTLKVCLFPARAAHCRAVCLRAGVVGRPGVAWGQVVPEPLGEA